jgi:hypothetical protein
MMQILDVFEYRLTTDIFVSVSLAMLVASAGFAIWMTQGVPERLPANVVRRAL